MGPWRRRRLRAARAGPERLCRTGRRVRCLGWEVHGRRSLFRSPQIKKAVTCLEVTAFGRVDFSVGWLHHPVRVGRLMPTLVRTREMTRPRNIAVIIAQNAGAAGASVSR